MRTLRSALVALSWLLFFSTARAQNARDAIPPLLAPWVPWVLAGAGDAVCPQVNEVRVCVWPSELALEVGEDSAQFTLRLTAERTADVPLPGSAEHWPEEVLVDGKRTPVLAQRGRPEVQVGPGGHTVSGRFTFRVPPASLQLPESVGAVSLRVRGRPIAQPRREPNGLLWIEESAGANAVEERLTLSIHRRIVDGVPLRILTRVQIAASGSPRETVLPSLLLAGTRAIELTANLPAQLSPDGGLRMQVQSGAFRVEITSIAETPPTSLRAPRGAPPYPDHEVWVFEADPHLRHVELSGAPEVDPARTDLAEDFRGLPTYLVAAGETLKFETRRRGEPNSAPNQLSVTRTMWLDLDGEGYTVRDQLTGKLSQEFRLDLAEGTLGRAVLHEHDELITRHRGKPGIELRESALALTTEWRLEQSTRELPAVGYDADLSSLSTSVQLPPGYLLLAAEGVDRVEGAWLESWDLFDFFFVLVVALAVMKLGGRLAGLVALLTLTLTYQQPDAPSWSWAVVLAMTALVRVAVRGRFDKVLWGAWLGAWLVLALVLVPFLTDRIRAVLYPQLQPESFDMSLPPMTSAASMSREVASAALEAASYSKGGGGSEDLVEEAVLSRKGYAARDLIDPNAGVQTGPGVPDWGFSSAQLAWSGPVERSQRIQLWLVPPFGTRLWAAASVLLCGLLAFLLARIARQSGNETQAPRSAGPTALLLLALAAGGLVVGSARAQESEPSPELLEQLRTRLTAEPACAPECVTAAKLSLRTSEDRIEVRVELHAKEGAIYRAPGPLDQWPIEHLRMDGQSALSAARLADGSLHVRVPAGIHLLELSGPAPAGAGLSLALGSPRPRLVEAEGTGFVIEGLHPDGRAEDSLVLRREQKRERDRAAPEQALTTWLEVRRELELGLRFRIRTTVKRLGAATGNVLLRLPLLPGEAVTEAGLESDGESVVVSLGRGDSLSFESTLAPRPELVLRAAIPSEGGQLKHPYSEHWVVRPSTLYRVHFEGIAPVAQLGETGWLEPSYRPFPGESLTVRAERLEPAAGATSTIDKVDLRFSPGSRMERATLRLGVRNSRASTERIVLPQGAQLTSLQIAEKAHPARVKAGVLELPLAPGSHAVELTWTRPIELGLHYAPSSPKLQRPLSNVRSRIELPQDRWVLAVGGPSWGPAVLMWGYLLLVILVAVALARLPHSPLRTREWVLLGLGLTQVPAPVAMVVVVWLFALAYRERHVIERPVWFKLGQIALIMLSLAALGCLVVAIEGGLVGQPDMQVHGLSDGDYLWYVDRTVGTLPEVSIWSAPLWFYRALMLLWSLWLASRLLGWLRWGFHALRKGGMFRREVSAVIIPSPVPVAEAAPPVPGSDDERA